MCSTYSDLRAATWQLLWCQAPLQLYLDPCGEAICSVSQEAYFSHPVHPPPGSVAAAYAKVPWNDSWQQTSNKGGPVAVSFQVKQVVLPFSFFHLSVLPTFLGKKGGSWLGLPVCQVENPEPSSVLLSMQSLWKCQMILAQLLPSSTSVALLPVCEPTGHAWRLCWRLHRL